MKHVFERLLAVNNEVSLTNGLVLMPCQKRKVREEAVLFLIKYLTDEDKASIFTNRDKYL